jgi:hypothetical protein
MFPSIVYTTVAALKMSGHKKLKAESVSQKQHLKSWLVTSLVDESIV